MLQSGETQVVDLKKWKQRNAAERVKAALTRPKSDNTGQRLRARFSTAADAAIKALSVKGRSPWLKYGYNDQVVVTTKLGAAIIPVTGDQAIALPTTEAAAFLRDVIEATKNGQLDRQLLAAANAGPRSPKAKRANPAAPGSAGTKSSASASRIGELTLTGVEVSDIPRRSLGRAPFQVGLKGER